MVLPKVRTAAAGGEQQVKRHLILMNCPAGCDNPVKLWVVKPQTEGASVRRLFIGCDRCGNGWEIPFSAEGARVVRVQGLEGA